MYQLAGTMSLLLGDTFLEMPSESLWVECEVQRAGIKTVKDAGHTALLETRRICSFAPKSKEAGGMKR